MEEFLEVSNHVSTTARTMIAISFTHERRQAFDINFLSDNEPAASLFSWRLPNHRDGIFGASPKTV